MRVFLLLLSLSFLVIDGAGCAHRYPLPAPITTARMVRDLGRHFHQVFPEADGPLSHHDAGLIGPRFGAPAIVRRDQPFSIDVLERGGPIDVHAALVRVDLPTESAIHCLDAPAVAFEDCFPLSLQELTRTASSTPSPGDESVVLRTLRATLQRPASAHVYDLVLISNVDPPQRARHAVFLTDFDPQAPRALHVVQISDLHLGKFGHVGEVQENLDTLIGSINQIAPDLVIVTGDLAEQGRKLGLEEWAGAALLQIDAPLLIIPGNHDYGHFPKILHADEPNRGWFNFARVFHPYRFTHLSFGGWEFVGFDSGPSIFSLRILTRGIDQQAVQLLRQTIDEAARDHRRGVVLFSHAPTRAVLRSNRRDAHADGFGSMVAGAEALEAILLNAAARGQRVLHLSGHTHWSDVFVAKRFGDLLDFERWPFTALLCAQPLDGTVAMLNAPSATVITFATLRHGNAAGFVELQLDADRTTIQYRLHDRHGQPLVCPGSAPRN